MVRLFLQEMFDVVRRTIENNIDVCVTSSPRIMKNLAPLLFESRCDRVAKPVQRFAQRGSPFLIPVRMTAGITAAVARPPFDAVCTAPCASFPYFCFLRRRMPVEVLTVVGQLCEVIAL